MSSSGEEIDLDDVSSTEHGSPFHWHEKDVKKLATYVLSNMTPDAFSAPFDSVHIDWEDVEDVVGADAVKCKRKWRGLLHSVRKYRTLPEIICDILSQQTTAADEDSLNNKKLHKPAPKKTFTAVKKKKKTVNPNHPKRPRVNGYSIYWSEVSEKMTGVERKKGVSLMLTIGGMWKQLPDEEKERYNVLCAQQKEEYIKEVQEYAEQHPDDEEIQKILAEEMLRKSRREGAKTPTKRKLKAEDSNTDEVNTTSMTITEIASGEESICKSPEKKKKKKKRAEEKIWTAEDSFLETKYDEYKQDYPDLSDEEVKQKLMKKFKKLSEKKLAKYKRMAEEKNNSRD